MDLKSLAFLFCMLQNVGSLSCVSTGVTGLEVSDLCVAVYPGFRVTDMFLSVCLRICILFAGRGPDMRSLICSLCVFQDARFVNGLGVRFAGLYVRELFEGVCPRM